MKRTVAAVLLAAAAVTATPAVFAVPTVEAVQAEVVQGRYDSAEAMMREVVAAKPRSARAHYVYAELLAHNGQLTRAAAELQQAKQLDPQLRFTSADKLQEFERKLTAAQGAGSGSAAPSLSAPQPLPSARTAPQPSTTVAAERAAAHASSGGGLPGWVWGLGGMGIALVLWRVMSRRPSAEASGGFAPAATYPQPAPYGAGAGTGTGYPGQQTGYGPAYGAAPSAGSGLAKAGLAVAGGFAAGMLAERLLHGDDRDVDRGTAHSAGSGAESRASAGNDQGFVPGMFDDVSSTQQDLSNRGIDFGSGDGWGGGEEADAGGGSGSDDGW